MSTNIESSFINYSETTTAMDEVLNQFDWIWVNFECVCVTWTVWTVQMGRINKGESKKNCLSPKASNHISKTPRAERVHSFATDSRKSTKTSSTIGNFLPKKISIRWICIEQFDVVEQYRSKWTHNKRKSFYAWEIKTIWSERKTKQRHKMHNIYTCHGQHKGCSHRNW